MTNILRANMIALPSLLIALMVATRYHHFGDVLHLPDASLAVFFLAGYSRSLPYRKAFFGFLLLMAGLIDYAAISAGTSAWCVSPAYIFLAPTYGLMWWGGHLAASLQPQAFGLIKTVIMTLPATLAAFILSNLSFYWFSGKFVDMGLIEYASRVAKYFPQYLGAAVFYVLCALVIVKVFGLVKAKSLSVHE